MVIVTESARRKAKILANGSAETARRRTLAVRRVYLCQMGAATKESASQDPAPKRHNGRAPQSGPNKSTTDRHMAALITTEQHFMMALKRAETDDGVTVVMKAV
jgi:hypothetical protein